MERKKKRKEPIVPVELSRIIEVIKHSGLPDEELKKYITDITSDKIEVVKGKIDLKIKRFKFQQIRRSKSRFKEFMDKWFNAVNNKELKNYGV